MKNQNNLSFSSPTAVLCVVSQGFSYSCALPWSFWAEEASSLELSVHSNADKYFHHYSCIQIFFLPNFQIYKFQWLYFIACHQRFLTFFTENFTGMDEGTHTTSEFTWKGSLSPVEQEEQCERWKLIGCFWFIFSFSPVSIPCPFGGCSSFNWAVVSWVWRVFFVTSVAGRRLPNNNAQTQDYCRTLFLLRFNLALYLKLLFSSWFWCLNRSL